VGGSDESAFFGTFISPALLRNGLNAIAVELHQSSQTSSDLGFDLRLTGSVPRDRLSIRASVNVLLEGPFDAQTGQMEKSLNTAGYLAARYPGAHIPAEAIDSIGVEIRNAASAGAATMRRFAAAWLLADGSIRGFADTAKSYVEFDAAAGPYYIVVGHANHLAVMTGAAQSLGASTPPPYNFTFSQSQAFGTNPMKQVNPGVYAMYAGDGNGSGIVTAADANSMFGLLNG
jgi:hypothetical protein